MTFDQLHAAIAALVANEPEARWNLSHTLRSNGRHEWHVWFDWPDWLDRLPAAYFHDDGPEGCFRAATPAALLDAVRAAIAAHRKEQGNG